MTYPGGGYFGFHGWQGGPLAAAVRFFRAKVFSGYQYLARAFSRQGRRWR